MNLKFTIASALVCSGAMLVAAPLYDVTPQSKRAAVVDSSTGLIRVEAAPQLPDPESINNPFSPRGFDAPDPVVEKVVQQAPQATASNRDLLASIAPLVRPGGTVMLGGQQILIFGQKKLKVGDKVPIVFADKTYEVVIAAIDRTSFTLRLNGEEITRPIKSANTP